MGRDEKGGGHPEIDPDTHYHENPLSPRTEDSIGITFSEAQSAVPYEQTLLGMLVTCTQCISKCS